MTKLTDWSARRAGGAITIDGTDPTGARVKVSGCITIASTTRRRRGLFGGGVTLTTVVATHSSGAEYELA